MEPFYNSLTCSLMLLCTSISAVLFQAENLLEQEHHLHDIAHRVEQLDTYPIIRIPVQNESQKAEFFDYILLFYSPKQNHFR